MDGWMDGWMGWILTKLLALDGISWLLSWLGWLILENSRLVMDGWGWEIIF